MKVNISLPCLPCLPLLPLLAYSPLALREQSQSFHKKPRYCTTLLFFFQLPPPPPHSPPTSTLRSPRESHLPSFFIPTYTLSLQWYFRSLHHPQQTKTNNIIVYVVDHPTNKLFPTQEVRLILLLAALTFLLLLDLITSPPSCHITTPFLLRSAEALFCLDVLSLRDPHSVRFRIFTTTTTTTMTRSIVSGCARKLRL